MPVHGWDASDYDWDRGPMNLAAAAADGAVFFTHKATEGTRTKHARYGEAMRRALDAGVPLQGAYMVPRTPGNGGHGSIRAQVDYFLSYLDSQWPSWRSRRGFFLQVDTEHWGYDDVAPRYGAEACALLRALTGRWVVHYAPRWAYGDTVPGNEPLWASSYGVNPTVPYRQAYPGDSSSGWQPYSGRTPVFLQYGSRTTIGSQPTCDANAFRGTLAQLTALVTGGTTMDATQEAELIRNAHNSDWCGTAIMAGNDVELPQRGGGSTFVVKNNLHNKLDSILAGVRQILEAEGVEQAKIDALIARPTSTVTLTPDMVGALAEELGAILVAHPDTPLGEADEPAIIDAVEKVFRNRFASE